MFKHSFLITFRSFRKFKSSFFINLLAGLSTGLACALLICLWVNDELNFDKFHDKDSRLYQVMERQPVEGDILISEMTAGLVAETLAEEMPEVEYATAVIQSSWFPEFTLSGEQEIKVKATGQFVGKDYLNVFSFNLFEGNENEVLRTKNSIVISEELALKLFGTSQNLIGQSLKWQLPGLNRTVKVTGVFKGVPRNSGENFDFLLSLDEYKEISPAVLEWGNAGTHTYLALKEGTDAKAFSQKIAGHINRKAGNQDRSLFIRPYSDRYLYGKYENGKQAGGRIAYVQLFSVVAIFIIIIACINFMNLSTAKAGRRMKEVSVKKAIGAGKGNLIAQFMGESLMVAFLSLIVAIALVIALLPWFNDVTGKQLSLHFNASLILSIIGITLFTGVLSGSYPAFYLSGFNPVSLMKRGPAGGLKNTMGEVMARKGLVIFQFTISVILIVAVLVVHQQLIYIQSKNLGYNSDNIIYFESEGAVYENQQVFISETKKIPGILAASAMTGNLTGGYNTTFGVDWEGKDPESSFPFEIMLVNYGMPELLGIEMKEGRTFSEEFKTERSKIIFNEAAIEAMGLQDPVGKVVRLYGEEKQIVGVTKNFHFKSLHEKVKPLFFSLEPDKTFTIIAKIKAGKEQESIVKLQELHSRFNPGLPLNFKFLDDAYQAQYETEQKVSLLSRYFAGIAILISCLGLYGLVSFSAEQRRKEIGIRKVLGASVANIMALLSKDFVTLVVFAILIGSAFAWIGMNKWLEGFAYRIEPGWWVFGTAGAAALFIALCTVAYQAIKAAMANPVKNLRTE